MLTCMKSDELGTDDGGTLTSAAIVKTAEQGVTPLCHPSPELPRREPVLQ